MHNTGHFHAICFGAVQLSYSHALCFLIRGMGEDDGASFLEKIWDYVISFITWFDKDGYDLFDMCPEYPEPDWDLFEPEEKRCRKLSEIMNPYDGEQRLMLS